MWTIRRPARQSRENSTPGKSTPTHRDEAFVSYSVDGDALAAHDRFLASMETEGYIIFHSE